MIDVKEEHKESEDEEWETGEWNREGVGHPCSSAIGGGLDLLPLLMRTTESVCVCIWSCIQVCTADCRGWDPLCRCSDFLCTYICLYAL